LTRSRSARPISETTTNLGQGYLQIGAKEIVRLDNDRNFPQNGILAVRLKGAG